MNVIQNSVLTTTESQILFMIVKQIQQRKVTNLGYYKPKVCFYLV